MKNKLIVGVLIGGVLAMLLVFMRANGYEKHVDDPDGVFRLVNDYRIKMGLKPLRINPTMCAFAAKRVEEIKTNYSHDGFDQMAKSENHPFNYVYAGENIDEGSYNAEFSVNRWIQSESHRQNMESPHYTDTCIVIKNGYAVQLFASF